MNGSDGRLANTEASKDCAVWRTRGGSWKVGRKMSSTDLGVVWTQLILYWAAYNTILYCKGKHTVVINSLWITNVILQGGLWWQCARTWGEVQLHLTSWAMLSKSTFSCFRNSRNKASSSPLSNFECKIIPCTLQYYMWQSWVEIEHYSVAYFQCVTAFEALYHRTMLRPGLICTA